MKLKSIMVGDIVKVVPEDAFAKVCDFLENKHLKNEFEVRYIDYNDKKQSEVWYAIIPKGLDIAETKVVGLKKSRLEVITPVEIDISIHGSINEMLSFNATGKKVLKEITNSNIREIEKDYFMAELEDGEYVISYIPFEKIRYMDNDFYNKDLRSKYARKIKPIKIIQEIINIKNNKFLTQDIVDGLLACINKEIDADFVIVSGKDISKYYNEKKYASLDGTLGNSCMRHHSLSIGGAFYIYEDCAEMVILKDKKEDKILGRAILWTMHGDSEFEGKKLLDRIYTINDSMVGLFIKFAIDNGFYYLKRQTYGTHVFLFNEKEIDMEGKDVYVNVPDRINNYMSYPYIDTFQVKLKKHLDRLYMRCWADDNKYVAIYNCTGGVRSISSDGQVLGLRRGYNLS